MPPATSGPDRGIRTNLLAPPPEPIGERGREGIVGSGFAERHYSRQSDSTSRLLLVVRGDGRYSPREELMPSSDADFWNGRFATESYVFGTRPAAFVVDNAHHVPPRSRVLTPADGEGRNSVYLAEMGHRVVATDIAEEGLAKARKLADARGVSVEFRRLDLLGWQWPEAEFDAVVAVFIQFAPPAFRDEIFAGMKRAVRAGGVVLLHGYTPKQLDYRTGGPSVVAQLYTEELLRAAFADWELLRIEAYERELDEGEGHQGRSAIIDLIARRPEA